MNINEDLKIIETAVAGFRRHDEVDAYRIVQPAETALRRSCERMKSIEEQRAKYCYDSDLLPEIKKFVNALHQYTKTQDFKTLRTEMHQIRDAVEDFNKSVEYLVRTGLVKEEQTKKISDLPKSSPAASVPPLRRKTAAAPPPEEPPSQKPPVRRPPASAKKTLEETYFPGSGSSEAVLNRRAELVIKITAEDPDSGQKILQYYLANKNAFRRKESYPNFWCRLLRKNKIICYRQIFRVSDWKPLFTEKNISDEIQTLSRNIFGVPHEGNLQDDGLILKFLPDRIQISFKTYGERTSKLLRSEFSGQTRQTAELLRKDFADKNEKYTCHYQDTLSFYHQFNHVDSDWNQKEVLVRIKLDLKLK